MDGKQLTLIRLFQIHSYLGSVLRVSKRRPWLAFWIRRAHNTRGGGGRVVLPYKRLIGMCRWMGSHFHDWSVHNGVAFSIDLLEWSRKFSDFWDR